MDQMKAMNPECLLEDPKFQTHRVNVSGRDMRNMIEKRNQLPKKKWKNFKSFLTDKWGVRSRVIWCVKDECFKNWSLLGNCWARMQTHDEVLREMKEKGGDIELSSQSEFMKCKLATKEALIKEFGADGFDEDDFHQKFIEKWAQLSATGNHVPQAMRETHGYGIIRK